MSIAPYICDRKSHKGCPTKRAEIIPIEPDAGNADEGKIETARAAAEARKLSYH